MEPVPNSTSNTSFPHNVIYSKSGWIVAFTLVAVGTILGNCVILAVFLQTKILHRRSSYLIINLTIADGLVGVISIPLFICNLLLEDKFGKVLYNVYAFQDIVLGLTSVSTLAFIAAERFYAIRFPMKYRASSTRAHVAMIVNSWLFGTAVAVARILTSFEVITIKTLTYVMVSSITVPLVLTCILYIAVWRITRARPAYGRVLLHENRLSVTFFIVTSVFIISWTPFPIANIVVTFWPRLILLPGFLTFINVTKLLHYGNSLSNPIIYTLKMKEFRKSLVHMLCSCWSGQYGKARTRRTCSRSTISSRSSSGKKRKTDSPAGNEVSIKGNNGPERSNV